MHGSGNGLMCITWFHVSETAASYGWQQPGGANRGSSLFYTLNGFGTVPYVTFRLTTFELPSASSVTP